jgi:hypothetical protein
MNDVDGRVRTPWWLERGDAICVACGDAFHPEATVRCGDCDDLVCATCVVEVADEDEGEAILVVCHTCAEARG